MSLFKTTEMQPQARMVGDDGTTEAKKKKKVKVKCGKLCTILLSMSGNYTLNIIMSWHLYYE